jgi:hypothetical protein
LVGAIYQRRWLYKPGRCHERDAAGARQLGVTIEQRWQADAFEWTGSEWKVTLTKMVESGGNLVVGRAGRCDAGMSSRPPAICAAHGKLLVH